MNEANIYVLNEWLEEIRIIDDFVSFIWTDRYNDYGDFELVLTRKQFDPKVYKMDYIITIDNSDRGMIIESIELNDSIEDGVTYIITGRSLESLMERRVIGKPVFQDDPEDDWEISGNIDDDIGYLITDNMMLAENANRLMEKIWYAYESYSYDDNHTYGQINHISYSKLNYKVRESDSDYMGLTVGQAVWNLCKYCDPIESWPSTWKGRWPDQDDGTIKKFNLAVKATIDVPDIVFQLYQGVDRSFDQSSRATVEFSRFMDNLGDFTYNQSNVDWKNAAMLRGNFLKQKKIPKENDDGTIKKDENGNIEYETEKNEDGTVKKDKNGNIVYKYEYEDNYIYSSCRITIPSSQNYFGMARREIFLDTNVERRKRDKDGNLTDNLWTKTEFVKKMKQQGYEALYQYQSKPKYSVELIDYGNYIYGRDYFIGDIVQVVLNDAGSIKARVSEVVRSWDNTGFRIFPNFELIEQ